MRTASRCGGRGEGLTLTRRESVGRRVARAFLIAFYSVAGFAHLIATDAMVAIVPRWVPFPREIVIATGVCELAGAIALLVPRWRVAAGWALAAYALCVWPANVQHAIRDLSTGTGLSLWYHAPRLVLQPVIIWWALWASGATDRPRRRRSDPNP